ncbi:hypothetical protein DET49_112118 [Salegentibacter sp. 24]|uniref:hypothetical protein n=1 Tax=Salegentibacter sp. 24 TaxID=2183986 RepID=UPI0010605E6E|nr:hypothetical protein [Salegentibacter sp. 24]TDN87428.1 hypothetical protein DET49_112118 [Salegentibacter sp. 24]
MTDKLIERVFEKAGKESGKDSVNGKAEYLAEHISEVYKFQVSSKTLTRYQKKEYSPSHPLTDYFSKFLGHKNYGEFVKNDSEPILKAGVKIQKNSKAWIIALILFPLIGVSAYVGYQNGKEECMIWQEDHFEKTTCSGAENEEILRAFRLENFKKIAPTETTTFFKNGKAQVWYDKSNNELEFFTAPGTHPTNDKTLKPITTYIIEKYIRK